VCVIFVHNFKIFCPVSSSHVNTLILRKLRVLSWEAWKSAVCQSDSALLESFYWMPFFFLQGLLEYYAWLSWASCGVLEFCGNDGAMTHVTLGRHTNLRYCHLVFMPIPIYLTWDFLTQSTQSCIVHLVHWEGVSDFIVTYQTESKISVFVWPVISVIIPGLQGKYFIFHLFSMTSSHI
jgi:hypothetical protein